MSRVVVVGLVLLAAGTLAACGSGGYGLSTPPTVNESATCHLRSYATFPLPDSTCTPGAINPAVSPATESTTVCKSGWTSTVRPPSSYTDALKRTGIAAYGYADKRLGDYEEDHLVPLEIGGSPTNPQNLWPEPLTSARQKDQVENAAGSAVCSGKMSLTTAQRGFMTNWVLLGRVLGVPHL